MQSNSLLACPISEIIKQSLEAQRAQILAEFEAERVNHQRVLRDYARLEQRYQNLEEELELVQSPVKAPRNWSASSSGTPQGSGGWGPQAV